MENTYWGLTLPTLLTISIIGGLIVIFVLLYVIFWYMARRYRNKNDLHGSKSEYNSLNKGEENGKNKENTNSNT